MKHNELFSHVNYAPHVGQLRFHESDARFKILIAGARFGKSLASSKDTLSDLLGGPTRGWLVAPTYALAQPEFRYILTDLQQRLHATLHVTDGGRGGHSLVRTGWGGELLCLSAHRPHTLLGEEIDWLILCEAAHIDAEAFQRFLRARLTSRRGRLVVPTTPHGFNWVHDLYQLGRQGTPGWESFRHATAENPHVAPAEIEAARATLPAEVFDEQFGGAFTTPAGAVYREFSQALHVIENLQPPPAAIIHKAIDYGFTEPLCCLWAAMDGDGRLLVLREHHEREQNIDAHAATIRAIDDEFRAQGCEIGAGWADPSGPLESNMLAREGVVLMRADNRVPGGIAAVRRMLARRKDGKPGLYVSSQCRHLLREFELYRWEESTTPGERVPRKTQDHALDALRYLCVALQSRVDWNKAGIAW